MLEVEVTHKITMNPGDENTYLEGLTVYLCGPMTNREEYNRPAFFDAEATLEKLGAHVINPANLPLNLSYESYMEFAWQSVKAADLLLCLEYDENSTGVKFELVLAQTLGKMIMTIGTLDDAEQTH
mgnify:CR=1 FL=1